MHTVIVDECTGCDLCVAPCPVDCIDMLALPQATVQPIVAGFANTAAELQARATKRDRARRRFEQRNARLQREEEHKLAERLARSKRPAPSPQVESDPMQAAIERVRAQKAADIDAAVKRPRSTWQ